MSIVAQVTLGLAATATSGVAWGVVEARSFVVRHATAQVLPAGAQAVRVLHVSDLHLTSRSRKEAAWVRGLAELEPDLVVNTGDNLAGRDAVPTVLDALGPLLDRAGVFVNGSNDYFAPLPKNPLTYFRGPTRVGRKPKRLPTEDMTGAFLDAGWLDLNNHRGSLEIAGTRFAFAGMDDPHLQRDAMPSGPAVAGDVNIGVVHAPYKRALNALIDDGAQIVFAGHTHGGQVRVPGVGALVTNCDLDRGRARGLHGWPGPRPDQPGGEHSAWLHVSAGAGTSPYAPIRFACRPEATLLELTAVS